MKEIAQLIRRLEAWLQSRLIPVEHFGWVTLGEEHRAIGGPVKWGIWTTTPAQRESFYRHNRWVMHQACQLRSLAIWLERR